MTADTLAFFGYTRLPEPYLLFHMKRRFVSPRIGLTKAGPYDAELHGSDDIHIGLITEPNIAYNARKFVQYLEKGHNYYRGFKWFFKVNSLVFNDEYIKTIENKSLGNILSCVENAYLELAEKLPDKSTVIVMMNDEIIKKNYSKIKSLRFSYKKKTVRLQLIERSTLEKALNDEVTLNFTLLNLATAVYTKAGCIPWVLESQLIPAGIFIGMAFTKPKVVRFGDQTREIFYYGILTVYNKFGKYIDMNLHGIRMEVSNRIWGTKGLYIPENDMIQMLTRIINAYKPPIVVIHKSARFHTDEIEAVRQVLESEGISYALIHIESSNPYRGYGEDKYDATTVRGDLVLDKELDRAILFTTGYVQGNQDIHRRDKPGAPKPLELEIKKNTTPYSIRDLAKQIFGLTKLDWNTTDLEVRMPITIKYARKVAALTPHLGSSTIVVTDIRDLM